MLVHYLTVSDCFSLTYFLLQVTSALLTHAPILSFDLCHEQKHLMAYTLKPLISRYQIFAVQ